MFPKNSLLRGTAVLTAVGLISRLMGFFFRIFLSHAFGEENVGLYQLIFPLYALCISIGTAGIQTAVSRMTAERAAQGKKGETGCVLAAALGLTLGISLFEFLFLQENSAFLSRSFLGDPRCEDLILILSYSLPCAAVHSCICGYSFGLQKTGVPALSQLIEQTARILFVTGTFFIMQKNSGTASIKLAAGGIVAGELVSAVFSAVFLAGRAAKLTKSASRECRRRIFPFPGRLLPTVKELLRLSVPLTANRTSVTLLQSVEAASIPACLKLYGMNMSDALSMYGVLTGMALPCILFPSALTNSVGTVLLPAVTSAQASNDRNGILRLIRKSAGSCFILGLSSCLLFLLFGRQIGELLFHSSSAGRFILTLAWICPFLYTNTALLSSLNGLGKTASAFLINMTGLLVRIAGVFLAIPRSGMEGYLIGLLISQLTVTALSAASLLRMLCPDDGGREIR